MSENLLIVGRAPAPLLNSLRELGLNVASLTADTPSDVQVMGRAAEIGAVFLPLTPADAIHLACAGFTDRLPWRAKDPAVGWDRTHVRHRLTDSGLLSQPWRPAPDEQQIRAQASELPLPLSVSPAVSAHPGVERRVDDLADLSLATRVVRQYAADERLLLETFAEGASVCVLGWVTAGRYQTLMAVEHHAAKPPARFPVALSGPMDLSPSLEQLVMKAVSTLEIEHGAVRVSLRNDNKRWQVTDVDLCPSLPWLPEDLAALAGGTGYWEVHARIALGQSPEVKPPKRGAAIAWLASRSGQVARVPDEADLPEGCKLCCGVKPGDAIGHVLDLVSRNRLGYVVVTSDTPGDAAQTALDCRAKFMIQTRSVMEASS